MRIIRAKPETLEEALASWANPQTAYDKKLVKMGLKPELITDVWGRKCVGWAKPEVKS